VGLLLREQTKATERDAAAATTKGATRQTFFRRARTLPFFFGKQLREEKNLRNSREP
jgi:hypothetical protein